MADSFRPGTLIMPPTEPAADHCSRRCRRWGGALGRRCAPGRRAADRAVQHRLVDDGPHVRRGWPPQELLAPHSQADAAVDLVAGRGVAAEPDDALADS